ncbi:MAG: hypothetical protein J7507_03765, partial [Pseudoxanthomonas sp.]|nr:hypothetical protein [Pseudoxanthomonas sp.]
MPGPAPPCISLRGIRLHYRKVEALRGIDLDIPAGQMVGLIGPDGVGKSRSRPACPAGMSRSIPRSAST